MHTHCSTVVLCDESALNDLCFLVSGCGITLGKHRLLSGLQEHGQHDRATQTLPEASTITQGPKCRGSHHSFCTQGLHAYQAEHPQDSKRRVKVSLKMRHSTHACLQKHALQVCTFCAQHCLLVCVQSGCPAEKTTFSVVQDLPYCAGCASETETCLHSKCLCNNEIHYCSWTFQSLFAKVLLHAQVIRCEFTDLGKATVHGVLGCNRCRRYNDSSVCCTSLASILACPPLPRLIYLSLQMP